MRTPLPILLLILGLFPSVARAQIPRTMSYQGYITSGGGDPISGPTTLTFRLYDGFDRGSLVWTETHPNVPVEGGVFNVTLGETVSLQTVDFSNRLYLSIQVASEPQLTPRTELAGAASALTLAAPSIVRHKTQVNEASTTLQVYNESTAAPNVLTYAIEAFTDGYGGAAVFGRARTPDGSAAGVFGRADGWGDGVVGVVSSATGEAAGVYGVSNSVAGFGGSFYGHTGLKATASTNSGPDIVLGGNDAGRIFSNPDYAGSDIWLHSNDAVVVKLDSDKSGDDSDFEVRDMDDVVIFDVDESGDVYSDGVLRHSSDANRKERFDPVDQAAILERVRRLPIQKWSYIGDPVRHLGPTAQDFRGAFGLGEDDVSIATVDMDGVALAAIQGLYDLVRQQQEEIARLKERLEAMGR